MRFLSTKYAKNAFAAPLGELTNFNVNMDWKTENHTYAVGLCLSE